MPRVPLIEVAAERGLVGGPFGSSLGQKDYSVSGVPVIRGTNLGFGRALGGEYVYVSEDKVRNDLARNTAKSGDLVFTQRGTLGQVALVPEGPFPLYVVSQSQMRLRVDPSIAFAEYLYYACSSSQFLKQVDDNAISTGVPHINLGILSRLSVPLPELSAQQAIAEVLGALDDKIAANTKLAATATGLLHAHFGQLGLNSDPDDEDEIISLDELVELNPKVPAPREDEPVYVDMQKLPTTGMSISGWERRPAKGGARFMNDDTLLARITPCLENRKTGYVDFLPEDQAAIGSTEFIVLRSRPGVPKQLSYFLATSERFRTYAIRHMVGTSGRQRVSALDLAGYTVSKPEPEALARFKEISSAHFELLKSLTDENRTLAETRDALLPHLMSGRLRVKKAEARVAAAV